MLTGDAATKLPNTSISHSSTWIAADGAEVAVPCQLEVSCDSCGVFAKIETFFSKKVFVKIHLNETFIQICCIKHGKQNYSSTKSRSQTVCFPMTVSLTSETFPTSKGEIQ